MSLAIALRAYLLADAAVATLAGARMYPRKLPQGPVLPAIAYTGISDRRTHDMDGPDGLPRVRMQLSLWAASAAGAEELAAAVRGRLDGFRGAWGDVQIGACLCVSDGDLDDPATGRAGVRQDYMIQYREA